MSGFLAVIAARAVGSPPPVQPRRAQRFELADLSPSSDDGPLAVVHDRVDTAAPADPPAPPDVRPAAGTIRGDRGSHAAAVDSPHDPARRAPPPPDTRGRPDRALAHPTDDLDRARRTGRDAAERAARIVADPFGPSDQDAPLPPIQPTKHGPPAGVGDGAPADQPASIMAAKPDEVSPAPPSTAPTLDQDDVRPAPADTSVDVDQPWVDAESRPAPPEPPLARPTRPQQRARPVDLAALLREEVFSALVERGSVQPGVTPVVQSTHSPRTPRPGTAAVRAEGVRVEEPTGSAAVTPGDIHVTIARVTVAQAPASPAPRVSRSESVRRSVDHQAYLTRRRERG